MGTYISMLRGINVGRQKAIKMDALSKMYESLGFKDVRTYIQSGNVIFQCKNTKTLELTKKIEEEIKKSFGFEIIVLIRTEKKLQETIKNNPFNKKNHDRIYVTFLSGIIDKIPIDEINKAKSASEEFLFLGSEVYLYCPDGYGRTKLSNNFFEKKLNLPATTRNWKTVNMMLKIAQEKS
jgi:uncharacterized protein (DUF1697 family)